MKNLQALLEKLQNENSLIYGVLSSPKNQQIAAASSKLMIRPVKIKNEVQYQLTEYIGPKAHHQNLSARDCFDVLKNHLQNTFKQALFCTAEADYHILINRLQKVTILHKPPSKKPIMALHNRKKHYLLEEGIPVPFLISLGVMTQEGKIISSKWSKFRQINRFLEYIDDILPHLQKNKPLHIVDFGSGKAYLTFALYHYLYVVKQIEVEIVGLDLKEDVVKDCQNLAHNLGYSQLNFFVGDIEHHEPKEKIDMVVTLHACDTATDAALEKAVRWKADVILSVPCCQHELFKQVSSPHLAPILEHGILKERFSSLVTDAARVQLLELLGYQTQILEFIDMEHTPKNLLIRAVRKKTHHLSESMLKKYQDFKRSLSITPSLEVRFAKEINL